jgi:hypothetical protein
VACLIYTCMETNFENFVKTILENAKPIVAIEQGLTDKEKKEMDRLAQEDYEKAELAKMDVGFIE